MNIYQKSKIPKHLQEYFEPAELGLEKTPEEYIAKMVEIFSQVKRVLRKDGTCWLNLGDSYWGGKGQSGHGNPELQQERFDKGISFNVSASHVAGQGLTRPQDGKHATYKPKDLCMIPARVALALQADGWWLRSDIIWAKPNPMPESVKDRPTNSHEHIFLLTKSRKYFYDADAVREKANYDGRHDTQMKGSPKYKNGFMPVQSKQTVHERGHERWPYQTESGERGRNLRNVWSFPTKPFPEAHFAVFPPRLPELCIKAGTSEKGCCSVCGAPWVRVMEKNKVKEAKPQGASHAAMDVPGTPMYRAGSRNDGLGVEYESKTIGWKPTCKCDTDSIPCTVLDPFHGAGTTGMVTLRLGRKYIGIELSPKYVGMSKNRIYKDAPLFNSAVLDED